VILLSKSTDCLFPRFKLGSVFFAGFGAEVADESSDFLFVLRLIVVTIKDIVDLIDIWKSPAGFGEVQHLSLDIREGNAL
jgi:hypothetical protein